MRNPALATDMLSDAEVERFPIGAKICVSYPAFEVELTLISRRQLCFHIAAGPFATTEIVSVDIVPLGQSIFVVSWREKNGATVVNVQDYGRLIFHSYVTMRDGQFMQMAGRATITRVPAAAADDDDPNGDPTGADTAALQVGTRI